MNKITSDTIIDIAQGNPGGLSVMLELMQCFGPMVTDIVAQYPKLRGPELWLLYKDENDFDLPKTFEDIVSGGFEAKLEGNRYSAYYKKETVNG